QQGIDRSVLSVARKRGKRRADSRVRLCLASAHGAEARGRAHALRPSEAPARLCAELLLRLGVRAILVVRPVLAWPFVHDRGRISSLSRRPSLRAPLRVPPAGSSRPLTAARAFRTWTGTWPAPGRRPFGGSLFRSRQGSPSCARRRAKTCR